jgi:hypothetical protein
MKILKYLFMVAVVALLVFSCKKERVSKTIGESSQRTVGVLGHIDYVQSELNDIDQVKVRFAKILSNAISKNPSLKQMLFEVVFDEESKSSEEVFILDLIETKGVSLREETIRDLLLTDGGVTEDEFLDLENTFCQDYPNLAIDVPAYVEMAYSSDKTRDNFVSTYQDYPFVIMPSTHEPNSSGTWTGYSDMNQDGISDIYEIPSGGTYQDAIPLIIKASERNLLLTDDLTLINGLNIIESYLGNGYDSELIQCFIQQIGEKKAAKILCGQEYDVLSIDDIITILHIPPLLTPPLRFLLTPQ